MPATCLPVELYRDWSLNECKLDPRTINHRLRTVRRFYDWCFKHGFIDRLPYDNVRVSISRPSGFLAHVDATGGKTATPHFMLRQLKRPLKFLTLEQCKECIVALSNPTHRLIFWLMLATGLRNAEARTFPDAYTFDPKFRRDLDGKAKLRIALDPADMRTKGAKHRSVDVPISLMSTLWWWSVKQRPARTRRGRRSWRRN
jgi:integrase/recombinase XerD